MYLFGKENSPLWFLPPGRKLHEKKNKQTKLGFETLSPQMYWILRIPYPSPVQIIRRKGGVLAWGTGYFLGLRKSKAAAPRTCPSRVFLSVSVDGQCVCLWSPTLQVAASHMPLSAC